MGKKLRRRAHHATRYLQSSILPHAALGRASELYGRGNLDLVPGLMAPKRLALVSPAICRGLDPIRDVRHGRGLSRSVDDPANGSTMDPGYWKNHHLHFQCAHLNFQCAQGDRANPSILLALDLSSCDPLLILPGLCVTLSVEISRGLLRPFIGTLNLYGNSLGLGFASTIEVQIARRSGSQIMGYRAALFFRVAISGIALIHVCFVRLVKDDQEGWHGDGHMEEIELTDQAEASGVHLPNVPLGTRLGSRENAGRPNVGCRTDAG